MVVEVVGGLISGSLALLADAGHMLGDAGGLTLALIAFRVGRRPASSTHSYGFRRAEVIAALVNAVALLLIAGGVLREAVDRLHGEHEIQGPLMLGVAVAGLVVNAGSLAILRERKGEGGHGHGGHGHGGERNLNMRGAWLHVLGDFFGSVGAVISGVLVWSLGWTWADPVASLLITVLITVSALQLLRSTLRVLMEGTPEHLDAKEIQQALEAQGQVRSVHDLHVWAITTGHELLTAHVIVREGCDVSAVLVTLQTLLRARFGIEHTTLQLELEPCDLGEQP